MSVILSRCAYLSYDQEGHGFALQMMLVSAIARLNTWKLEQSLYVNFLSFKAKQPPDHVDSFCA